MICALCSSFVKLWRVVWNWWIVRAPAVQDSLRLIARKLLCPNEGSFEIYVGFFSDSIWTLVVRGKDSHCSRCLCTRLSMHRITFHGMNLRGGDNICATRISNLLIQNIDQNSILRAVRQSTWWQQRAFGESRVYTGLLLFFQDELLYVFYVFHAA